MASCVLVTGGSGYIGSHTVRHLRERGYRCLVADNLTHGHMDSVGRADFHTVDTRDEQALDALFAAHTVDAVIHFAGDINVGESVVHPQKYYRNNVTGTLSLLDAMVARGVRHLVFSSTCAVYGEPVYLPLDEAHPRAPINPYGQTKMMVENILEDYRLAYGLQYMALRYFNAAGASPSGLLGESHSPETHLIPLALKAVTGERPPLKILGTDYDTPDGTCIRDYVHVDDLAAAHRLAMENLLAGGVSRCLNLGTGQGHSVLEIVRAAEEVTGKSVPVEYAPRRPGDAAVLCAANAKARETLGWNPEYLDIKEIVRTAWNWERGRLF